MNDKVGFYEPTSPMLKYTQLTSEIHNYKLHLHAARFIGDER
jgi:hypothetical protein